MAILRFVNIRTHMIGLTLGLLLGLLQPLSAQPGAAVQSNYNAGVEAYRNGDFRRAFDAWSLGAYEGVTEAQYNLGVLYLEGRGVENNIEQARHWFEEEVRLGLLARLSADPAIRARMDALGEAVAAGRTAPGKAAAEILAEVGSG